MSRQRQMLICVGDAQLLPTSLLRKAFRHSMPLSTVRRSMAVSANNNDCMNKQIHDTTDTGLYLKYPALPGRTTKVQAVLWPVGTQGAVSGSSAAEK